MNKIAPQVCTVCRWFLINKERKSCHLSKRKRKRKTCLVVSLYICNLSEGSLITDDDGLVNYLLKEMAIHRQFAVDEVCEARIKPAVGR